MSYLLHQLLSESAARRPEAEAVRLLDQAMTYGELESRSNQLARLFVELGVASGDRVGIYLRKSPAVIVCLFGILKAGACYVPIDVGAPALRVVEIAAQCKFRVLMTNASLQGGWQASLAETCPETRILLVEDADGSPERPFFERLDAYSPDPFAVPTIGNDLAYILFTSGSTGQPKGVMLSHLNGLTFVNWAASTFAIGPQDRLSNHAPLNFDLSIFDIFVAIKAGAAISLVPERLSIYPLQLADFIEAQGITVWYSVPMVLTLLQARGKLAERHLGALRWILFAGEVFPTKHLRALMEKLPRPRYANLYGPTETNVCAYYEVAPFSPEVTKAIPIGRACANTELIAIDAAGRRLSGPGKEGLLYVRGTTVMQGYYGQPENTEAAFSPNPFAVGRKEQLYCTGDWVALDEQGNYLFIGRKDDMIKTRGYRVELGEIEAVMVAHPAVDEAVALAIPDEAVGNMIQAVVTVAETDSLEVGELKRHCAERLPSYMVPEKIEFCAVLPRTPNGKIDRQRIRSERIGTA